MNTDSLVMENLGYVKKLANKWQCSSCPFEDLVQEGAVGLLTAAKTYNPESGVKFITWAHWQILAQFTEYKKMNATCVAIKSSYGVAMMKELHLHHDMSHAQAEALATKGKCATDTATAVIGAVSGALDSSVMWDLECHQNINPMDHLIMCENVQKKLTRRNVNAMLGDEVLKLYSEFKELSPTMEALK